MSSEGQIRAGRDADAEGVKMRITSSKAVRRGERGKWGKATKHSSFSMPLPDILLMECGICSSISLILILFDQDEVDQNRGKLSGAGDERGLPPSHSPSPPSFLSSFALAVNLKLEPGGNRCHFSRT